MKNYETFLKNNDFKFLNSGLVHNVYKKNDYIYKIVKPDMKNFNTKNHFNNEFVCHQYLLKHKIKVVKIEKILKKGELIKNHSVLVEKFYSGVLPQIINLKQAQLIISYLNNVAKINNEYYGPLFKGKHYKSWKIFLIALIKKNRKLILRILHHKNKYAFLLNYAKNTYFDDVKPSFLIMDPNPENFIIKNGKEVIGLDIDHPVSGDILWQQACVSWYKPKWNKFINCAIDRQRFLVYQILFAIDSFNILIKNKKQISKSDKERINQLWKKLV